MRLTLVVHMGTQAQRIERFQHEAQFRSGIACLYMDDPLAIHAQALCQRVLGPLFFLSFQADRPAQLLGISGITGGIGGAARRRATWADP